MTPLLEVPHNWVSVVEHTRAWPTATVVTRNGTERRNALSLTARETLRYTLTVTNPAAHQTVMQSVTEAATAATSATRGLLRVPRWEDAMVLSAPVAPGATSLSLSVASGDDAGWRRFANSGEIALWVPGTTALQTAPLAASGAVGTSSLTLLAGIASAWPAGTRVAPVALARIVEAFEWDRVTGTVATGTLLVTLDTAISGTATVAVNTPGRAQRPVVASVSLTMTGTEVRRGFTVVARAVCRDAAGVVVPAPGPITWNSTNPNLTFRVPEPASGIAYLDALVSPGGGTATITATEPISGLTGSTSKTTA